MVVSGDNPIQRAEDDVLGRDALARSFARQILGLDTTERVVVGVLGPWGSGKTSFLNLARPEFEKARVSVLDFNPWMFSGTEQLVDRFFSELAAQLKLRPGLAKVGEGLEDYGEAFGGMLWLPVLGPWIERGRGITRIVGKVLRRRGGIGERRAKLEAVLSNLPRPLVVILDDIDRLSTPEIRDAFKLVRLTASFPNIIYLVAFDRLRVERALAEQGGVTGREYLEKVLLLALDLPAVPEQVLNAQIFTALNNALDGKPGTLDEYAWPDIFMEIIRPLVRNMRDIRRYAAAVHLTVEALDGEVAIADVLALEAIRVFLPDVFSRLHGVVDALTSASEYRGRSDEMSKAKGQITALIDAAGPHANVVRSTINRLFFAAQHHIGGSYFANGWRDTWLKDHRVAHEYFLRFYLERVAGEGLEAFKHAGKAWSLMADRDAFEGYLRSLGPEKWQDVVAHLETFEEQFTPAHVVPATIALLNLLPDLPERERGLFDLEPRLAVTRVTFRLLRSLKDPAAVEEAVRQILPEVKSLSAKLELISQVGHREGAGHKLASEIAASDFERAWRDEVRAASAADLAVERDLARVCLCVKRDADPSEGAFTIEDSPALTLAFLRSARSDARFQSLGSSSVRREPRFAWKALVELFGDEAILRQRIDGLKAARLQGDDDLVSLAIKYCEGWRPKD